MHHQFRRPTTKTHCESRHFALDAPNALLQRVFIKCEARASVQKHSLTEEYHDL
jgi:hypothetical protein